MAGCHRKDRIGVKPCRVDYKGILSRLQRSRGPFPVTPVTGFHILENVAEHSRLPGLLQLLGAPPRTFLQIGIDKEFEIGIRQDHAADVTAIQNGAVMVRGLGCKLASEGTRNSV